jgi:hypothetical protein
LIYVVKRGRFLICKFSVNVCTLPCTFFQSRPILDITNAVQRRRKLSTIAADATHDRKDHRVALYNIHTWVPNMKTTIALAALIASITLAACAPKEQAAAPAPAPAAAEAASSAPAAAEAAASSAASEAASAASEAAPAAK